MSDPAVHGRRTRLGPSFSMIPWPHGLSDQLRAGFLAMTVVYGVLLVATVVVGPADWLLGTASVLASVFLAIWWIRGFRRRRFPLGAEVVEVALLIVMGLALKRPSQLTGVLYGGLMFRLLYGSLRQAIGRLAAYLGGFLVLTALIASPAESLAYNAAWVVPSLFLSTVLMRIMAAVLNRHERGLLREKVLAQLGADLMATHDRQPIYQLAVAAATSLAAGSGAIATLLTRQDGRLCPIETVAGVELAGQTLPDDVAATLGNLVATGERSVLRWAPPGVESARAVNARVVPLVVDGVLEGAIVLGGTVRLPHDIDESLTVLAGQVALAIESATMKERLRHRASHDSLTDLPNRALFAERVEMASRHDFGSTLMAVLFIDLDDFKMVNDTLGHQGGDELLSAVAKRLASVLRAGDLAARLGGDEFAILAERLYDARDAVAVGDRVLQALSVPFIIGGQALMVRSSVGIAVRREGQAGGELLRQADIAMYLAKAAGKARAVLFDESMQSFVVDQSDIATDLERALAAGEFSVHYQPAVELATGHIVGVEALARWTRADGTTVPPLEFIPLAEATGLILPLGRLVLDEACRQVAAWRADCPAARDLFVGVNISAVQLTHPGIVGDVTDALVASGLGPQALILDIPEAVFVDDTETATRPLRALQALGIKIALDGFGSGYSSLAYLKQLPVDILKIDKIFVDQADGPDADATLLSAVVHLAQVIGLDAVAEGIETTRQLECLRAAGCLYGQGFLFGRPVAAPELTTMLDAVEVPAVV